MVLQDSCKTQLCSGSCFLAAILLFVYIFCWDNNKLSYFFKVKILFYIGNIYRDYIVVYLF